MSTKRGYIGLVLKGEVFNDRWQLYRFPESPIIAANILNFFTDGKNQVIVLVEFLPLIDDIQTQRALDNFATQIINLIKELSENDDIVADLSVVARPDCNSAGKIIFRKTMI